MGRQGRTPILGEKMVGDSYQIPRSQLNRLNRLAKRRGTSKGLLIRSAIELLFEKSATEMELVDAELTSETN